LPLQLLKVPQRKKMLLRAPLRRHHFMSKASGG